MFEFPTGSSSHFSTHISLLLVLSKLKYVSWCGNKAPSNTFPTLLWYYCLKKGGFVDRRAISTRLFLIVLVLLLLLLAGLYEYKKYKDNFVTEERRVMAVSTEYLSDYKAECEAEGGTFCAKIASEDRYTGANAYSDTLHTTEYILTCTKPKKSSGEPACVSVP